MKCGSCFHLHFSKTIQCHEFQHCKIHALWMYFISNQYNARVKRFVCLFVFFLYRKKTLNVAKWVTLQKLHVFEWNQVRNVPFHYVQFIWTLQSLLSVSLLICLNKYVKILCTMNQCTLYSVILLESTNLGVSIKTSCHFNFPYCKIFDEICWWRKVL